VTLSPDRHCHSQGETHGASRPLRCLRRRCCSLSRFLFTDRAHQALRRLALRRLARSRPGVTPGLDSTWRHHPHGRHHHHRRHRHQRHHRLDLRRLDLRRLDLRRLVPRRLALRHRASTMSSGCYTRWPYLEADVDR
jgi:hypothetical protein